MSEAEFKNFSRPFSIQYIVKSKNLGISSLGKKVLTASDIPLHWSSPHLLIKGESWKDRAARTGSPIPWHKAAHANKDWNDPSLKSLVEQPCKCCRIEKVTGTRNFVGKYCRSCLFRARVCISCNGLLRAKEYLHCGKCLYQHSGSIPVRRCEQCGNPRPERESAILCRIDGKIYRCCFCYLGDRCQKQDSDQKPLDDYPKSS